MRILHILVLSLIFTFGCDKSDKPVTQSTVPGSVVEEKIELDKEVLSVPEGIVPISAKLSIQFRNEMVSSYQVNTVLAKSPFKFSPEIKGETKWVDRKTVVFQPDKPLPAGSNITGEFNGKTAFGSQKDVDNLSFSFKVAEQEVMECSGDFEAVPKVKNGVYYKGTIRFAQPVDLAKVQKDVIFKGKKSVKLTIEKTNLPNVVKFKAINLMRSVKGQSFKLILPKSYTAFDKKYEKDIFLPGIDVFKILSHNDISDQEADKKVYSFRFNDPIKTGTDLTGYIDLSPSDSFETIITGKYLKVKGDFKTGTKYKIEIKAGFPSVFGTTLKNDFNTTFSFKNSKPEIKWLSKGVYLPSSNDFKLQFASANVSKAYLTVHEIYDVNVGFFLQNNKLMDKPRNTDNNNDYYYDEYEDYCGNSRDQWKYQDLNRVGEQVYSKKIDITSDKNKWIRSELDLSKVFKDKNNSLFVVSLSFNQNDLCGPCTNQRDDERDDALYFESDNYYDNPCNNGFYYKKGKLTKLLIASDIALTLKKSSEGTNVYATNVKTAKPVSGLKLSLFSKTNKKIETETTNGQGMALFTKSGSYIYGHSEIGTALIELNHKSWEVNNFEVDGISGNTNKVNMFLYADRGVHRPGDTIHLAGIVRQERKAPVENQPIILEFKNPRGQKIKEVKVSSGKNGHIYYPFVTEMSDPTGDWQVIAKLGNSSFYKTLKVETVKPNRLKVNIEMEDKITASSLRFEGKVNSKYLFGAPAAGLRATIKARLEHQPLKPDGKTDYIFQNPERTFQTRMQNIADANLDENGDYNFNSAINNISNAPSIVKAQVVTTVYEKGGNFTKNVASSYIIPYSGFVGIKKTFEHNYAKMDENYSLPIVVTNEKGEMIVGHKVKVTHYVNNRYWWWHYNDRNKKDFRNHKYSYKVNSVTMYSKDEPLDYTFKTEDYGNHFILVEDLTSGHETGFYFYVSYYGNKGMKDEKSRNTLQISSDKINYNPGEKAAIAFPTPANSMALVTIEQGDKILNQEWVETTEGMTNFSFSVTDEMIPNCYASVSLIQPHNKNDNDVPMRIYGIKNIKVEDINTKLPLLVEAPEVLAPKEDFKVKVTSKSDKVATYTIAIVDEGLLDLTAFSTPNPWKYFFQKIRLGIITRDNFDEILGTLLPDMDKFFSIGGGFEAMRKKRTDKNKTKRFKPVVLYQKPVTIKPGQTITTDFKMHNYVGSVRLMVVGCAEHSYTKYDKAIPVKTPLMILPTIPRVARPGDKFNVPVSVFAMDSTVSKVQLSIDVSKNLKVYSSKKVNMNFPKPMEMDTFFTVEVLEGIGADTLTIEAVSGKNRADYTVHLPVNSGNPYYTEVLDTILHNESSLDLKVTKFGLEGSNSARIVFSKVPDIQLDKRLKYLIRYPYGCLEQTTSSVFPQLYLFALTDLSKAQSEQVTKNINASFERLAKFKIGKGFAYWPFSNYHRSRYSGWATNYAGHYMLTAKELGYHVPEDLLKHWIKDAQYWAKKVDKDNYKYQSYRLYLLAVAGKADMGAMNYLKENHINSMDALSRTFLAAAYHITGKTDVAHTIHKKSTFDLSPYRELSGTFGSSVRDMALIGYLSLKMNDMGTASKLLKKVVDTYKPYGWYSTQEVAFTLLFIGSFYKHQPLNNEVKEFVVNFGGKEKKKIKLQKRQMTIPLEDEMWGKTITVTSKDKNVLFVTLLTEGIPLEDRVKTEHQHMMMTRNFYDEDGNTIDVSKLKQGKPVWVVYTLKSKYNESIDEVALTSLFPSGWEIINTRVTGEKDPQWVTNMRLNKVDYMDIRDDRVNWFFSLKPYKSSNFGIKINPTFKGMYVFPSVAAEAMYSPEYYSRIESGTTIVH